MKTFKGRTMTDLVSREFRGPCKCALVLTEKNMVVLSVYIEKLMKTKTRVNDRAVIVIDISDREHVVILERSPVCKTKKPAAGLRRISRVPGGRVVRTRR